MGQFFPLFPPFYTFCDITLFFTGKIGLHSEKEYMKESWGRSQSRSNPRPGTSQALPGRQHGHPVCHSLLDDTSTISPKSAKATQQGAEVSWLLVQVTFHGGENWPSGEGGEEKGNLEGLWTPVWLPPAPRDNSFWKLRCSSHKLALGLSSLWPAV